MSRGWLRTVRATIAVLAIVGLLAATPAVAQTRMVVARGPVAAIAIGDWSSSSANTASELDSRSCRAWRGTSGE